MICKQVCRKYKWQSERMHLDITYVTEMSIFIKQIVICRLNYSNIILQ